MQEQEQIQTFSGLGIAPKFLDILAQQGYKSPTPIQKQAIPIAIQGKDVMGIAQTGTGKTLAFGIPMLQKLVISKGKGLILIPTRELAIQVSDALKKIGRSLGLKTAVIIGGESMGKQISALRLDPHIIIATPGRLIDMIDSRKVNLSQVSVLVLDEADRMLDMGFAPQLNKIIPHLPKDRQTMLFSATMDQSIAKIAASYLQLPMRIEVAPAGSTINMITQEIIMVNKNDKLQLLLKTLHEHTGSTLVFSRTKHGARKIAAILKKESFSSAEIHSDRSLNQRLEALNGFKLGKYRVLVATDIAARGIDVTNIELVINYDLPENSSDYVHRIGRTGRAGKSGKAISFATADQRSDIHDIERLIKKTLLVKKASDMGLVASEPEKYSMPERTIDREHTHSRERRPAASPSRFPRKFASSGSREPSRPSRFPSKFSDKRQPSGPGPKRSGKPSYGGKRFGSSGSGQQRSVPRPTKSGPRGSSSDRGFDF
jgi:ATP-dependent RNA helicase RhlE